MSSLLNILFLSGAGLQLTVGYPLGDVAWMQSGFLGAASQAIKNMRATRHKELFKTIV